jgi:hypothetical protein
VDGSLQKRLPYLCGSGVGWEGTGSLRVGTERFFSLRSGLPRKKSILVMAACPFQLATLQCLLPAAHVRLSEDICSFSCTQTEGVWGGGKAFVEKGGLI